MKLAAGADEQVPVLIVGGGGAGLTASMLLAGQGVAHLLVSARPHTSDLPKAHVLNQRAMEVLEDAGVAEAIAQRSTPAAPVDAHMSSSVVPPGRRSQPPGGPEHGSRARPSSLISGIGMGDQLPRFTHAGGCPRKSGSRA